MDVYRTYINRIAKSVHEDSIPELPNVERKEINHKVKKPIIKRPVNNKAYRLKCGINRKH